jgi:hypothetical protein
MDDEQQKKKLNNAIKVLRSFCKKQTVCESCPVNKSTEMCELIPQFWKDINYCLRDVTKTIILV